MRTSVLLAALGPALALAPVALPGGFSSDPSTNTPVAAYSKQQLRPSLAPTRLPVAGWYAAWYDDGPDAPWPVPGMIRVQRLDHDGNNAWGDLGTVVVDFGTTIIDYLLDDIDLDGGPSGDAYVAFVDLRASPGGISAARVGPGGELLWPGGSVRLVTSGESSAPPKIAGVADGGAVVAWTGETGALEVRGLGPGGQVRWQRSIGATAGRRNRPLDLFVSADGSIVVAFVRERQSPAERELRVCRLSAEGVPLWIPISLVVSDSFQVDDYDPRSVGDGAGGAALVWCSTAGRCFVQHVRADGTERFGPDGVPVTETAPRLEDRAAIAYLAGASPTADAFVAIWRSHAAGSEGLAVQRIAADGRRLWGPAGIDVLPPRPGPLTEPAVCTAGTGFIGAWRDDSTVPGTGAWFARVNGDGTIVCAPAPLTTAEREFLRVAVDGMGRVGAIWQRGQRYAADIFAQDVNADCLLGLPGLPGEVRDLRLPGPTALSWSPPEVDPGWSNLYRGDVLTLAAADGGVCLQPEVWGHRASDGASPLPASGWFYLVSAVNTAGEGSLGAGTSGLERTPGTPCP